MNPTPPPHQDLQQQVQYQARAAGFATGGVAAVPALGSPAADAHAAYFAEWIAQGHAGDMEYLKRQDASGQFIRSAVQIAAPWARSIIVCAAPYGNPGALISTDPAPPSTGWIARYAWSGKPAPNGTTAPSDYHKVLLRRLKVMETALKAKLGDFQSWAYIDTGPVVERAFSALAGIGWTGKNTCTLSQELGSFIFLGIILTSLELPPTQRAAIPADRCGSCTRCIDACPTGALIAPYRMDASRCISYLTIEKRGPIDPELRPGMGRQLFGCDICQDVCPWNDKIRRRNHSAFPDAELAPRPGLVNPSLLELAALTRQQWEKLFFGSPISRARYEGFRRNLAIAMGNSGDPSALPQLEQWAADGEQDTTLREASAWAIAQLREALARDSGDRAQASATEWPGNGHFSKLS